MFQNNKVEFSYDEYLTIDIDPNNARGNSGLIIKGDTNERLRIFSDGRISIANSTATRQLYVYVNNSRTQYSDGWLARFHNDGNAVNLYGIEIFVGRDDGQYDNYAMRFCDGDGDEAGYIAFNSGTVTYGTFTAHHPCRIPEEDNDSSSFLPAFILMALC